MDRLWSPWRSQHVASFEGEARPGGEGSVFSRIARAGRDEEHLVLWRGATLFVVMNLYPYNNGHLLIVPYREVAEYEALTEAEQQEIAATIGRCIGWLRRALDPEGFNVGMNLGAAGGAGIPGHLHVHVVPRWNGDTNFMATIAETKLVPEHLRESYRKLREVVEESGGAGAPP